ncbi:MAG: hypothetical protein M3Y27_29140 [Acidobacteriota bacterium]|nr:hypothetical protein [Acidobacteriota bacterium]
METPFSLGKIVVPTAGTPVRLTAPSSLSVRSLRFSVIAGGTGKVYLGTLGLNSAAFAGVIKEFWPNTGTGPDDSFQLPLTERETYTVAGYWIDAAVSGEGLIVSGTTAPL